MLSFILNALIINCYKPENTNSAYGIQILALIITFSQNKMLAEIDNRFKEMLIHIQNIIEPFIRDGCSNLEFTFKQFKLHTSMKGIYIYSGNTVILTFVAYIVSSYSHRFYPLPYCCFITKARENYNIL